MDYEKNDNRETNNIADEELHRSHAPPTGTTESRKLIQSVD